MREKEAIEIAEMIDGIMVITLRALGIAALIKYLGGW